MHRQKEVQLPIKYVNLSESFGFLRTLCVPFLLVIVQGCWFEAVDTLKPTEPLVPQNVSAPETPFPGFAEWLFVDSPQALDIFVFQDLAQACVEDYFQENIWQDFMQNQCSGCHQSGALAENTNLVFDLGGDEDASAHNYSVVQAMALAQSDGASRLLLKATAQINHGGGEVLSAESEQALALQSLIEMMETPSSCLENQDSQSICGDGVLGEDEFCDDGYTDACGSCNADCTALGAAVACGDSILCPEFEACDDGFVDSCGSCNADCSGPGTGAVCGDTNHCPEFEVCDDGYTDACGTCNADCSAAGNGSVCGNTEVCLEFEFCDDGYTDTCGSCNADCSALGTGTLCGDDVLCPEFESCDEGEVLACGSCNATCSDAGDGTVCGEAPCVSTEDFFADSIWQPILSSSCIGCHVAGGMAGSSNFVLVDGTTSTDLEQNLMTTQNMAEQDIDGTSLLLLKASGEVGHGGGVQVALGSDDYQSLTELLDYFGNPPDCGSTNTNVSAVCGDGVVEGNEFCDDGYVDACGTCNADCSDVGSGALCGDQEICPEVETCDDGYSDSCGTCNADCSGVGTGALCGDQEICPEVETCDDGYNDSCGTCNADCSGLGTGSLCGDGVLCAELETCDEGDTLECGACNANCSGLGVPALCEVEPCVSDAQFFEDSVWNSFMFNSCYGCHNIGGMASASEFILVDANQPGYLELNFQKAQAVALYEVNDESLLWLKPSASIAHGGGQILADESLELLALKELVERFKVPSACADVPSVGNYWDDVAFHAPKELLRKTTLNLAGRLPREDELNAVTSAGDAALDGLLDAMLEEDAFYERLIEVYNELLLTDRYLIGNSATGLLDSEDYPNALYYKDLDPLVDGEAYTDAAKAYTNNSVAREALNLLTYIVRNNKPFYEILTADYMVMNPFSARSYGLDNVQFNDPLDPTEFQEVNLGLPHAGILTTTVFLRRFPTTDTNRNRHRSYMVYKMFLGTDVLEQESSNIDIDAIDGFNPTMYNPVCTVCHNTLDPMAGSFQNWDHRARYRPRNNGWYVDMLHPGFEDEMLPYGEHLDALPWLAQRVANDPRFAHTTVRTLFKGFTGMELLRAPENSNETHYAQKLRAFEVQRDYLQHLKDVLEGSNYNIKTVIKDIFLSPFMRASGLVQDLSAEREIELGSVGSARLLPPEMLHRKIEATMGTQWRYLYTDTKWLLHDRWYLFPYGGIDSVGVTKRLTQPNGVMTAVSLRMAMEMACKITTYDFVQPAAQRFLFPHIELSDEPMFFDSQGNNTGVNNPLTETKAKQNIQYLFAQLLGEELPIDDQEIQIAYDLFYNTWVEGMTGIDDGSISINLWGACAPGVNPNDATPIPTEERIIRDRNYLIRAWRAVISYLLTDVRMLYEF